MSVKWNILKLKKFLTKILLQIDKSSSKEIKINRDDLNIYVIEVCVCGGVFGGC